MTLCTLLLALLLPPQAKHAPPTGWIDCELSGSVYRCRP